MAIKYRIRSYLTGTNVSIADLASDGKFHSLERSQLTTVTILSAHFLNINDMICMIQYYWNIPDTLLTSLEFRHKLKPFVGRPLHFVDYVFRDLRLQSFVQKVWADNYDACEAEFYRYLDNARDSLTSHIEDRLDTFFRCKKSLLPSDLCEYLEELGYTATIERGRSQPWF